MMKSISLLKPSLNPEFLIRGSNLSLFLVANNPRASFRLLPHAQASGSGRNVWEEAAEEFFRAKGEKPAIKDKAPANKANKAASNYGDARSGRGEWDEKDKSSIRKNAGPSSGSQYKKAVSFAGREWGDEERSSRGNEGSGGSQYKKAASVAGREWGDERSEGSGGSQYKKAASFAGREWSDEGGRSSNARSSKPAWSNKNSTSTERRSPGPNGYKSDRGGGYGRRDGDQEDGDEEAGEWPKREAVNWRLEGEPLYGVAPIRAAFLASRREFHTLYVQESLVENIAAGKRKDKQAVNWILNRAHNLEIKVETVSKQNLNLLVDNRPHQGLVLDASPLELVPCEYLERPDGSGSSSPVWVALDEVIDPQNFGAILRSCHYLGATGVIVCAKNSAPLSGVVSKASAGALEVMEIQSCRNMMKFLETSVLNGWRAVGASSEPRALPIQELEPGLPTILVLGNEGRGLRTNVKRSCTELVSIKGFGLAAGSSPSSPVLQEIDSDSGSEFQAAAEAVDSLNVSVAAGILLHDLLSRSNQQRMPAE